MCGSSSSPLAVTTLSLALWSCTVPCVMGVSELCVFVPMASMNFGVLKLTSSGPLAAPFFSFYWLRMSVLVRSLDGSTLLSSSLPSPSYS